MNWSRFFRRPHADADLDEEIRSHLRMAAADRIERGDSAADAARGARREFGNDLLVRETTRDVWRFAAIDGFLQDLRYACRRLRSNRLFTAVAVLTLALGIGVNTAIFTLLHAVLFNTLPVPRPQELYRVGKGNNCCVMTGYQNGQDFALFSYDLYRTLRDGTPEIQQLAAFQAGPGVAPVRRAGSQESAALKLEFISSNYFDLFALQPQRGSFFSPGAESTGAAPTLVLSDRAWRTQYAADPAIVGSTLLIKETPFTVIGIAPPGFYGETLRGDPPDCWLPAATEHTLAKSNSLFDRPTKMWLYLMGRLRAGTNHAALEAKVNAETRRWYVEQAGETATKNRTEIDGQFVPIIPASGGVESMSLAYREGLILLMSLSSLVLLIACANVANLLLGRVTAMRAQNSLKIALGASRGRMLRQALLDSLMLALLGCAAGLAVAFGAARLIVALAFQDSRFVPISPTPSAVVLLFSIGVSLVAGLLFGAVPAWIETRSDPAAVLRGAGRGMHSGGLLPQRILVGAQAMLSFVLLSGAGLLTQSLWNLERQDFGFDPNGRVIVKLNPAVTTYSPERLVTTYRALEEKLRALPGVTSAALAYYLPMTFNNWNTPIWAEGSTTPLPGGVSYDRVSAGYFDAIGTRILYGRDFSGSDTLSSPRVALVNQTFVDRYSNGRSLIGMRFNADGPQSASYYQVIGVVADAKYNSARQQAYATFFLAMSQPELNARGALDRDAFVSGIVLRIAGRQPNLEPLIRRTIAGVDSNLGVLTVMPYPDQLALNFTKERLLATLTELFAGLALALASIGLYGLVALAAARRTAEIGVRLALGATRANVTGMILRSALLQAGLGILLGVPVSLLGTQYIRKQLFGMTAFSGPTLAGAAALLTLCAVAASLIPARRAARLDPNSALRME